MNKNYNKCMSEVQSCGLSSIDCDDDLSENIDESESLSCSKSLVPFFDSNDNHKSLNKKGSIRLYEKSKFIEQLQVLKIRDEQSKSLLKSESSNASSPAETDYQKKRMT